MADKIYMADDDLHVYKKLPPKDRRWEVDEERASYGTQDDSCPSGWPET